MMRIRPMSESNQNLIVARKLPEEGNAGTAGNYFDANFRWDRRVANEKPDDQEIANAIDVANEVMKAVDIGFKYYEDKATHIDVIEVIDNKTGDKIKQIPAEEIVTMVTKMYEMWGIFVDKKV